jgi:aminoglycoside phosphotransferase (APT) family kinase protein
MPPDSGVATIIHNDYKFDNLVLDPADPTRIVGVLDWEMATIGDPWMDLGASLAYWVEATDPEPLQMMRRLPTMLPGMMTRREVVARYARATGRDAPPFDFYLAFGLFRLAVIAQQIYYRYYHGQTKDERFAIFVHAVRILEETALGVIDGAAV